MIRAVVVKASSAADRDTTPPLPTTSTDPNIERDPLDGSTGLQPPSARPHTRRCSGELRDSINAWRHGFGHRRMVLVVTELLEEVERVRVRATGLRGEARALRGEAAQARRHSEIVRLDFDVTVILRSLERFGVTLLAWNGV